MYKGLRRTGFDVAVGRDVEGGVLLFAVAEVVVLSSIALEVITLSLAAVEVVGICLMMETCNSGFIVYESTFKHIIT